MNWSEVIENLTYRISEDCTDAQFDRQEMSEIETRVEASNKFIERSKIDRAIEEIKAESYSEHIEGADCDDILVIELEDVLEILRRNIGE